MRQPPREPQRTRPAKRARAKGDPRGADADADPARRRPRVALMVETSNEYARGLLRGVISYIREHRPWSIYLSEHGRGDRPPAWLASWAGDGIIARIETPSIAHAVRRARLPTVDVSAARLVPELPWVETDDDAIAHLAADHLLERGFRHFAYCGDARFQWSQWRQQAFATRLRAAGHDCHVYASNPLESASPAREQAAIAAWIAALPKPVGMMASFDQRGRQVIDACRDIDVAVPDEVAVVGVDNDDLMCELCDPPLSSVQPDSLRTGYEAARLLDLLMARRPAPGDTIRVPPHGVVTRRSSDVLAIHDEEISGLVRFIRDNACDGLDVGALLRRTRLSRRVLEHRFRTLLGCTPHQQILRVKLARVKELLIDTDLPLALVAERSGFKYVEYLSVVFKQKVGVPPSVFRERHPRPARGEVD